MTDTVLVLSGLDPCAGAGVSADIETINQFGVSALPLITALTVQNTQSVEAINEVDSEILLAQFEHLHADVDISTVKVGMLCSKKQLELVEHLLTQIDNPFVVLDPIMHSSTQQALFDKLAIDQLKNHVLPLVDVLTPNESELEKLAPNLSEEEAVKILPCRYVLVTKTDTSDTQITHCLYVDGQAREHFSYVKLPGQYHGSGCTLASAISALVALGVDVTNACHRALDYTYQTLLSAKSVGKMQFNPNRETPLT